MLYCTLPVFSKAGVFATSERMLNPAAYPACEVCSPNRSKTLPLCPPLGKACVVSVSSI